MNLVGEEILAEEWRDKMVCQIAYEQALDSKPILQVPYHDPLQLDEQRASRVVAGLVRVMLRTSHVYGLTQDEAAQNLAELYGLDQIARISFGEEAPAHNALGQEVASRIIDRACGTADHIELFMQLVD